MPLQLPQSPHERFREPPLRTMLGQVRFPPILRIDDLSFLAPFQDSLRAQYPQLSKQHELGVMVGPEGAIQTKPASHWRLTTDDGIWTVALSTDFLTVEAVGTGYTHYSEFRERFGVVWTSALEHLLPSSRLRLGLRYVNHVEDSTGRRSWQALIRTDLLGLLGVNEVRDEVEQALSDVRLSRPNGTLVIRHGLVRAGPAQLLGYLLDFDYFTEQVTDDVTVDSTLNQFDEFHGVIYPLFRWCITPEAEEQFGIIVASQ